MISCPACGDFAFDDRSAQAFADDVQLRILARSHIDTSAKIWPGDIASFGWQPERTAQGQPSDKWCVGMGWMNRTAV